MVKAIIFDFDGVIHDTFDFHLGKIREFSKTDFSAEEYRAAHDGNIHASASRILKEVDWDNYGAYIVKQFAGLKLAEEIKEELLELGKKHLLFIISSGTEVILREYLQKNGASGFFKEVWGLETHKSKIEKFNNILANYELAAGECLFVTDTLGDILEANKLGIKTIAVDFGYHDSERLARGKPFRIISDFKEIRKIAEQE